MECIIIVFFYGPWEPLHIYICVFLAYEGKASNVINSWNWTKNLVLELPKLLIPLFFFINIALIMWQYNSLFVVFHF